MHAPSREGRCADASVVVGQIIRDVWVMQRSHEVQDPRSVSQGRKGRHRQGLSILGGPCVVHRTASICSIERTKSEERILNTALSLGQAAHSGPLFAIEDAFGIQLDVLDRLDDCRLHVSSSFKLLARLKRDTASRSCPRREWFTRRKLSTCSTRTESPLVNECLSSMNWLG